MISKSQDKWTREAAELRARLEELEETLQAIRNGEVDALVVAGAHGDQIYTLQSADHSYRVLMETMSEGAATLAPDGTILYCNSHFAKLLKLSLQNLLGSSILNLVPASQTAAFQSLIEHSKEPGARKEIVFNRADGATVTVLVAVSALNQDGAQKISLVATDLTERKEAEEKLRRAHDELEQRVRERTADLSQANAALEAEIAERKRAEVALRESERRYSALFANKINAIAHCRIITDAQGRPVNYLILKINEAYERIIGIKKADIEGRTIKEVFPGVENYVFDYIGVLGKVALEGGEIMCEAFFEPTRQYLWLYAYSSQPGEFTAMFTDITERKRAEELLQFQAKHLEQLVQERTAKLQAAIGELEHFSYTITHDMRAPLRALQGYGELLLAKKAGLSEQDRIYLTRITNASQRMDRLITDALDYTKLSQRAFEIQATDVSALLRGMLDSYPQYQPPAAKISIAEAMPRVMANEAGLTQCFSNLLNNAVKFVKSGDVPQIRIWAEDKGEVVRFWVEDNGIGIPAEYLDRIFGMFQQLNKSYEGTGIGLALVRKAAQRMNGSAGVESENDKGSRFWLEFKKAI